MGFERYSCFQRPEGLEVERTERTAVVLEGTKPLERLAELASWNREAAVVQDTDIRLDRV